MELVCAAGSGRIVNNSSRPDSRRSLGTTAMCIGGSSEIKRASAGLAVALQERIPGRVQTSKLWLSDPAYACARTPCADRRAWSENDRRPSAADLRKEYERKRR